MGTDALGHLERGTAFKVDGNYDSATQELRAAIALEPALAAAHHQLGLVLGFTGEFDDSLSELQIAVDLAPESVQILIDLAKTQAMLGFYDEAKAAFVRALGMDPGNDAAKKNLAFLE